MKKAPKPKPVLGNSRKRKTSVNLQVTEPKVLKVETTQLDSPTKPVKGTLSSPIKKNKSKKKNKATKSEPAPATDTEVKSKPEKPKKKKKTETETEAKPSETPIEPDNTGDKYPILKNTELVEKFLKVPFSNNQKGRIRQAIKAQLQGSDDSISADIINGKIQAILKGSENLTDSDLRRIRILYNMLKTTLESAGPKEKEKKKKKKKNKDKDSKNKDDDSEKNELEGAKEPKKEKAVKAPKVKGPKRYVVFIGNLPLNVDKEMLMKHFVDIDENIKDIRIPVQPEGRKSAIAFLELNNEPTFEMALSKHHSMLDNKRINVMFTAQENSKLTKSEAKGKAAKLVALQKAGKLAGSTSANKKRSHRRNIMKRAQAKETAAENA